MSGNAMKQGVFGGAWCRDRTCDIRLVRATVPSQINDLSVLQRAETGLIPGVPRTSGAQAC